MSDWYILDGHEVVGPIDVLDAARWQAMNPEASRVAFDDLPGGWLLSTVFLGLDHGQWIEPDAPRLLFETMVFRPKYTRPRMELAEIRAFRDMMGQLPPAILADEREIWSDDEERERCGTWEEAEAQHARMRAKWLEKLRAEAVNGEG